MTWMRLDATVRENRKVGRLARRLGIGRPQAIGHLVCLWTWALTHAPDGELVDLDTDEIAEAAQWDGAGSDPAELVSALVAAGLIEVTDEGYLIHDWMEYADGLKAAKRQAKSRASRRKTEPVSRHGDVTVPSASRQRPVTITEDGTIRYDTIRTPQTPRAPAVRANEPEGDPDTAPASAPVLGAIVAAWNRGAVGSKVSKAQAPSADTAIRDRALTREAKRFSDPLDWEWCARAFAGSDGHNGKSTGFVASLPWLLERGKGAKLEQWIANGRALRANPLPLSRPVEFNLAEAMKDRSRRI